MILAVILMVMIVCMGAVVAVFIGMYMVQRTIQRHQHILQKRALAEKYIVLDRSEWQHGSSASRPSAPVPASIARVAAEPITAGGPAEREERRGARARLAEDLKELRGGRGHNSG